MKYQNAFDILPEALVLEIQKYVQGKIIYVPTAKAQKAPWGSKSGYLKELSCRNAEIVQKYENGMVINKIADEYFLSTDSIKKIIARHKKKA